MVPSDGAKLMFKYGFVIIFMAILPTAKLMSAESILYIDDRTSGTFEASSGNAWTLVTDDVMGGVSKGKLLIGEIDNRPCLHMQGAVSLENNGGFVQIALNLSDQVIASVTEYEGILLQVYGNGEEYNLHLRTEDINLPWQSYRASFMARPEWRTLKLPFDAFMPYRINKALDIRRLERIGIVAIGRAFNADLCVGNVGLYSE